MTIENFKEQVLKIFPNVTEKQIYNGYKMAVDLRKRMEQNDDMLTCAARLSLAEKTDIQKWRNILAEQGVECTPTEIELNCKIISIILDTL